MLKFYDKVRSEFGKLSQEQVDGFNVLLEATDGLPVSWRAYCLATAWHETNKTMQPVIEAYWLSEDWRKRNLRYYPWYGRGYVQLTWKENYKLMDDELGLGGQLLKDPSLAQKPDVAAKILVVGMTKGFFNGKRKGLGAYINCNVGTRAEFREARRTVNILDKADQIAGYALTFQEALLDG